MRSVGSEKDRWLTTQYALIVFLLRSEHTDRNVELSPTSSLQNQTLLKRDLHMVLPQTPPDYTPIMQCLNSCCTEIQRCILHH